MCLLLTTDLRYWCHLEFTRADGNPLEKMDKLLPVVREKFLGG
jgi:hypothetical protein